MGDEEAGVMQSLVSGGRGGGMALTLFKKPGMWSLHPKC